MARQTRSSFETRESRKKLPVTVQNAPPWTRIHPGLFIGFYQTDKGKAGIWYMRRLIEDNGKKRYEKTRLAIADDYQDADGVSVLSYAQAQKIIFEKAGKAAPITNYTVQLAADDYLAWFKAHSKSYATTDKTISAHILPKFQNRKIESLTTSELVKWHQELVTSKDIPKDDPDAVRRYRSTANRILTVFKALLNHAWKHGRIKDNSVWKKAAPFKSVDGSRKVFLSEAQCKKLINVSQGDFKILVQGALYTGARPPGEGELSLVRVKDFNAASATVHIPNGKTGPRDTTLDDEGIEFFSRQVLGKRPDDLIFTNNGQAWQKQQYHRALKSAAILAELPKETVFYSLRHTYISMRLSRGMNIQVLAENVGTSVAMIQKHYGKFLNADRRKMMNLSSPSFGFESDNVEAIQ